MGTRRSLVLAASLTMVAVVAWAASASARTGRQAGVTIHVIEHATTDTVVDIGDPGDSTGDLLTFHNDVYDGHNQQVVGTDQGECVRIDPAGGTWECRWITMIPGGTLAVEGQFLDAADSTMAVTGGTGAYRGAQGEMRLRSRSGGAEYDFIFRLR